MTGPALMPVPEWRTGEPPEGVDEVLVHDTPSYGDGYSVAWRIPEGWFCEERVCSWDGDWSWLDLADLPPPPTP